MIHSFTIPNRFTKTIAKLQRFMQETSKSEPMEVCGYRWTNVGLQVFVRPWKDKPHNYCMMLGCKVLPPEDERYVTKEPKRPMTVKFEQTEDGFQAYLEQTEFQSSEVLKPQCKILSKKETTTTTILKFFMLCSCMEELEVFIPIQHLTPNVTMYCSKCKMEHVFDLKPEFLEKVHTIYNTI